MLRHKYIGEFKDDDFNGQGSLTLATGGNILALLKIIISTGKAP